MRTYKLILAFVAIALVAQSCNIRLPFVSRSSLEASQEETMETKQELSDLKENYARQNEELTSILSELSELSSQTTALHLNVENAEAPLSQAEQLDNSLDALRERISKLEKEADRARKLDKKLAISAKTIVQLKETVTNQENEITRLRQSLQDKEKTIKEQGNVIANQVDTIHGQSQKILSQQEDLQKLFDSQVQMLFQAGQEFEKLADEGDTALDVGGRKDKNRVKEYKKSIYAKAIHFYLEAAGQGHNAANERVEAVRNKMMAL